MATRRSVPAASSSGAQMPVAVFPTPPGDDDLAAQCDDADRRRDGGWHEVAVGDWPLRAKVPSPTAINVFQKAISPHIKNQRISQEMTSRFLAQHIHPQDWELLMLGWMTEPDRTPELGDVLRAVATVGTARPFVQSPGWPWP